MVQEDNLGSSSTGAVYKAMLMLAPPVQPRSGDTRPYGQVCAIKVMDKKHKNKDQLRAMSREVELLMYLRRKHHENIVRCVDIVNQRSPYVLIAFEYAELKSLKFFMTHFGKFVGEGIMASFLMDILSGLEFLHKNKIIHRDIKPGNVLVTAEGNAKLTDFGTAVWMGHKASMDGHAQICTARYSAPEVCEWRDPTPACDIWSVGCIATELVTRREPYINEHMDHRVISLIQKKHPEIPRRACDAFKDFMMQCFIRDPARRPSATTLKEHKFFVKRLGQWVVSAKRNIDEPRQKPKDIDEKDEKEEKGDSIRPITLSMLRELFEYDAEHTMSGLEALKIVKEKANLNMDRVQLLWALGKLFGSDKVISQSGNEYHIVTKSK